MTPNDITTLPTDNLYKFYSIAGIIIVIIALALSYIPVFDLLDKIHKLELESAKVDMEVKFLNEDVEIYEIKMEKLFNELSELDISSKSNNTAYDKFIEKLNNIRTNPEWRTYLEFIYKYEDKVFPEIAKYNEIKELENKIIDASRKVDLKIEKQRFVSKKIKFEIWKSVFIGLICSISLYFGLNLAIKGFDLWKTRVQDIIDRKNEIEISLLEADLKSKEKK